MSDLSRALKPWDADVRRKRALSFVEGTIVVVLPLSAILARWNAVLALGLAGLWLLAVAVAALWPTIPARIARHADWLAGLRAVCDTALHLRATGHPAADAVALDALDALARAPRPARPHLARPRALAMALAIAVCLAIVPTPTRTRDPESKRKVPERTRWPRISKTLEETARSRGDLALAEAARRLRTELEATPPELDVPRAAPTEAPPPPPPESPPPAPAPDSTVSPLFPPMEKDPATVSKWEADPVGKELAEELHAALGKYMSLDKMKNPAIAKARIMGGSTPFEDASQPDARGSAPGDNTSSASGPSDARDESCRCPDGAAGLPARGVATSAQVGDEQARERCSAPALVQRVPEAVRADAPRSPDGDARGVREEPAEAVGQRQRTRASDRRQRRRARAKARRAIRLRRPQRSRRPARGPGEAPSTLAKVDGPPDSSKSGGGGTGETSPGGAGAGQGHEGTPVSATPEPASGSGDPDRVRGQFRPGSLSPSQEEDLFDALEARAAVEGPFEQFGPEVRPYMSEAQKALESEPVDPRMKSWVESYLRHLAG